MQNTTANQTKTYAFFTALKVLVPILVIVAISAPLSRAEAGKSSSESTGIEFFVATHPPKAGPKTPFYINGDIERTIADYHGKVVVLNFWAMWCAPCIREMPHLDRLRALLEPEGGEVIALSMDRGGVKTVKGLYETKEIKNLEIVIDKGRKLSREVVISGLPTTIIYDKNGYEVGRLKGPAQWDSADAVALIRTYLSTNP